MVARSDLDPAIDDTVAALISASPTALMFGRDAFYGLADLDLDTGLDRMQTGLTVIAMSEDASEGVTAFIEKRSPEWRT